MDKARKWKLFAAAMALVSVAVSGCGGSSGGGGGAAPGGGQPSGSGGAAASGGGQARDFFKVGVITSLSGEDNFGGNLTKQGYQAWADYVNEQGGIEIGGKKYQVKLYFADDQSKPASGADAIERLINTEKVDFVLGPYTSGVTISVGAITEKYKVPHITGSAESPKVWEKKYKYTFGTIPAVSAIGPAAIDFFVTLDPKPQSIAIIGLDDAFSKATADSLKAAAEQKGLKVVRTDIVPVNTDFTPIVTALQSLNPDIVAIGSHEKAAIEIIKAAKSLGFSPKIWFQHYGMTNASFLKALGPDAEYVFGATYWLPNTTFTDPVFGTVDNYVKYYSAKFGHAPDYTEAACTAAGVVFGEALKQAGLTPPLDQAEKDKLVETLEKINVTTAFGPVKFTTEGPLYHDNVGLTPIIVQWQGGKTVSVSGQNPMARPAYPTPPWNKR
ncbi:amino acid ABC transporter substrate-binding protein [Caldinitratiruptor microaerophilus]|uniref:ABC transporter substrate-binding protein n=1 Tax=Caldinitratiruptor microaerophilus TaxID=671077 RepID=A0AA35G9C1_9FIRM|nr:amino acid ABC transporter substrate-binding protein [Caldinitratiruptor microaerophilus]BDG60139.1 ABC transporter substrate-binding protein [Caldinitratiruptor microaerophilus]